MVIKSRDLWLYEPAVQQNNFRERYRCIVIIKIMVVEAMCYKQGDFTSVLET